MLSETSVVYLKIIYEKFFSAHPNYKRVKYFTDRIIGLHWNPLSFLSIFYVIQVYGLKLFLKSITKNCFLFFNKNNYTVLSVPIKNIFFIIETKVGLVLIHANGKSVYKIYKTSKNIQQFESQKKELIKVLNQVNSKFHDSCFPLFFEQKLLVEKSLIVEISQLFQNTQPITETEWKDLLLNTFSEQMIFFYISSGIKSYPVKNMWDAYPNIQIQIKSNKRLSQIFYFFCDKVNLVHTALVNGDFQRFNVLRNKNGFRFIDFGGAYRENIFMDLYIQERWCPIFEFWTSLDSDNPIPQNLSQEWMQVFRKTMKEKYSYEFTDMEIKANMFFSLMWKCFYNGKSISEVNNKILLSVLDS